ncbi:MAG: molybdate ABC transporter substrate-binding protein [Bacillota bacterium]
MSCAMSLNDAMKEITAQYPDKGVTVRLNPGASGSLQRQIEQGAPVDLFISAGQKQMDDLEKEGLIDPETRSNLLGNEIALVSFTGGAQIKDFKDLTGPEVKRIAIADPKTAPAGDYARETLTRLGLWEKLQHKIVLGKDVNQVVRYVRHGDVDAGIIFLSDTILGGETISLVKTGTGLHREILYPAAVVSASGHKKAARDFLRFLEGPEASKVFAGHGFIPQPQSL